MALSSPWPISMGSGTKGVGVGMTCPIRPYPLSFCLLSWKTGAYWFGDLGSQVRNGPQRDTKMVPLNWKKGLLPGYFGLPMPLNHGAKKGGRGAQASGSSNWIDADSQGKIPLLLHSGGEQDYLWNLEDSLGASQYIHASPKAGQLRTKIF